MRSILGRFVDLVAALVELATKAVELSLAALFIDAEARTTFTCRRWVGG